MSIQQFFIFDYQSIMTLQYLFQSLYFTNDLYEVLLLATTQFASAHFQHSAILRLTSCTNF